MTSSMWAARSGARQPDRTTIAITTTKIEFLERRSNSLLAIPALPTP